MLTGCRGTKGLTFMSAVDHALRNAAASTMTIFLLRTYALCLPSVIGAVSPSMLPNNYVQTAIISYVYRYAHNSREIVNSINLGAAPIYFCLLCVVMAKHRDFKHISHGDFYSIFTYVFQGAIAFARCANTNCVAKRCRSP